MNHTQRILGLTDAQWEILSHRLEVPDCIADSLCDTHPDDDGPTHDRSEVEECVHELLVGEIHLDAIKVLYGHDLTNDVLANAVECSTWMGGERCEEDHTGDHLKASRACRSGEALAKKVGKFVGEVLEFPNY